MNANIKPCPKCSSGWVYADDLTPKPDTNGLVKCPACEGRGSILKSYKVINILSLDQKQVDVLT